jgi:hypothetical protein
MQLYDSTIMGEGDELWGPTPPRTPFERGCQIQRPLREGFASLRVRYKPCKKEKNESQQTEHYQGPEFDIEVNCADFMNSMPTNKSICRMADLAQQRINDLFYGYRAANGERVPGSYEMKLKKDKNSIL